MVGMGQSAVRVRLDVNDVQAGMLLRAAGARRFAHNWAVARIKANADQCGAVGRRPLDVVVPLRHPGRGQRPPVLPGRPLRGSRGSSRGTVKGHAWPDSVTICCSKMPLTSTSGRPGHADQPLTGSGGLSPRTRARARPPGPQPPVQRPGTGIRFVHSNRDLNGVWRPAQGTPAERSGGGSVSGNLNGNRLETPCRLACRSGATRARAGLSTSSVSANRDF
jgi:hypothetical protein